jgi:hypothetical protein
MDGRKTILVYQYSEPHLASLLWTPLSKDDSSNAIIKTNLYGSVHGGCLYFRVPVGVGIFGGGTGLSEVLPIGEDRILSWKQGDPVPRMDRRILGNGLVIDHCHLYSIEGDFEVL